MMRVFRVEGSISLFASRQVRSDLPTTILETIARIDGAVVLDANQPAGVWPIPLSDLADLHPEISRAAASAAIGASRFGKVLKISETD
jgi:hypothetical protein